MDIEQNLREIEKRVLDATIQVRCDSRTLATLLSGFEKMGYRLRYPTEIVRVAMEEYAQLMISEEIGIEFLSVTDARMYLEKSNMGKINPAGRGLLQGFKAMQKESIVADGGDVTRLGKVFLKQKQEVIQQATEQLIIQARGEMEDLSGITGYRPSAKGEARLPDNLIVEDDVETLRKRMLIEESKEAERLSLLALDPRTLKQKGDENGRPSKEIVSEREV